MNTQFSRITKSSESEVKKLEIKQSKEIVLQDGSITRNEKPSGLKHETNPLNKQRELQTSLEYKDTTQFINMQLR